ncbi:hypothetical protein TrLO_g15101 [Triparma laevis f. longispina]|uniref:Uncharacterized protein n=1 Tax=Triparma laevis f. longispina TaxID=1714387 RepID=A0A9W7C7R2_9STRA|nr:hypothetical protein TrLO_g15101 [Triparma laevis f. longispina]
MDENSLTADPSTWNGSNFVSVKQLTPEGLQLLFSVAKDMKALVRSEGGDERLKHRVLANVFYEVKGEDERIERI